MSKKLSITLGVVICLLIGFVSRLLHATAMEVWYPFIAKSPLTPLDIVFPIVWGILYILMGLSLGLLLSTHSSKKKLLLWLFAIQLILNVSWNYLFFYLQNPMLGFINIVVLDILGIIFYITSFNTKRSVAHFFLPYLTWMFFASYLNLYIVICN